MKEEGDTRTRVAGHDNTDLCCGCGEQGGVPEWVEEVGHRLCAACAAEMNRAVWARMEHGVEPKEELSGVQTAFREAASVVPWMCAVALDEVPLCLVPPMKLALVAGVHPPDDADGWVLIRRAGEFTGQLKRARLFPFTREGAALAREASHCRDDVIAAHGWTNFVARVLVVGPWGDPHEVVPVWWLEGSGGPRDTRYPWD